MNTDTTSTATSLDRSQIDGRYEVIKKLGSGSMGCVYLCNDTILDNEHVALKILFRDLSIDPTYIARFQREVILARSLGHDNIVRVFDYGVTDDLEHYFTMELLTGGSLRNEIKKGGIPFSKAVEYLKQIVSAIEHAHSLDVVHRDIKPDNILFSAQGKLKITDFGTARGAMAAQQNLTQTGDSLGTPIYMAPEIVQGGRGDKKSDLYSLGILAHELLTGKPPFLAQTWVALAAMHVSQPPPKLPQESTPAWYQEMVLRLLEKDPAARFETAAELLNWIEKYSEEEESIKTNNLFGYVSFCSIGGVLGFLLGKLL